MPALSDTTVVQTAAELAGLSEVPGPFLSMGEAVAAIGLLLAFYQLMTPGMRFRLRMTSFGRSGAIGLGLLAIVLSIVAAFVRVGAVGLPWAPVLIESLGATAIVGAAALLAVGHWGKVTFNAANAERFAAEVRGAISRGDPVELGSVMDDLEPALQAVFEAASRFDPRDIGRYVNPDILDAKEKETYHAVELIAALGDATLCRTLVTRSPNHAKQLMRLCTAHQEAPSVGDLVRQLMHEALVQGDSILHREMSGQGLGRFVRLVDVALGDASFIESKARPLACLRRDDAGPLVAKAMGHALTAASHAYLHRGADVGPTVALGSAFESLRGLAMWPLWKTAQAGYETLVQSPAFEISQAYADAVMELCEDLTSHPLPAAAREFDQDAYNPADDQSLWGRAVEEVIGVLALASHPAISPDAVRAIASSVWYRVERNPAPHYESVLGQLQGRLRCAFLKPGTPLTGPLNRCSSALVILVGLEDSGQYRPRIVTPKELRSFLLHEFTSESTRARERRLLPPGHHYNHDTKSIVIEGNQQGRPQREIPLLDVVGV